MSEHQARFQDLLRELFQFDSADLDFGIYRIMNHKRTVIERYIAEDLPKLIEDTLSQGALLEQRMIANQVGELQGEIGKLLGREALDSDGNLQTAFHKTPVGERYLSLRRRQEWHVTQGPDTGAAQATLYQHLYGFFSRYYDDGDIVSKRRYSRRERYAIPYNGEEVHLHWANKDQYYVKTGEHFRDYAFKAGNVTVRFAVVDADVQQGNVKGEKRYFFPRLAEAEWRDEARELHIPFEFRPATSADKAGNGQNHLQEALIAQAVEELPEHLDDVPLAAVTAERHRNGEKPVTLFEYHMRRFAVQGSEQYRGLAGRARAVLAHRRSGGNALALHCRRTGRPDGGVVWIDSTATGGQADANNRLRCRPGQTRRGNQDATHIAHGLFLGVGRKRRRAFLDQPVSPQLPADLGQWQEQRCPWPAAP